MVPTTVEEWEASAKAMGLVYNCMSLPMVYREWSAARDRFRRAAQAGGVDAAVMPGSVEREKRLGDVSRAFEESLERYTRELESCARFFSDVLPKTASE